MGLLSRKSPKIGIGITTRNRPEIFRRSLRLWLDHRPQEAVIAVVDDASDNSGSSVAEIIEDCSIGVLYHRFEDNVGVARAKNKALEMLEEAGCDQFFLSDDDTSPITDDWWKPYVDSLEHHLMYQPIELPSHWPIKKLSDNGKIVAYDKPRGCLLYVDRAVLTRVGGLSNAFGKHGAEHGDWSDRIHAAGLTTHPYVDVSGPARFFCLDEIQAGISSVDHRDHQAWRYVDSSRVPAYQEYKESPVPVLVPWRTDRGHREKLWHFLLTEYWLRPSGFQPIIGEPPAGPFNRSAAINLAAKTADIELNPDVYVVADADTWVPAVNLEEAVRQARATGRLTFAFTEVRELTESATRRMIAGRRVPAPYPTERVRTAENLTASSMLVVPRPLWERVRGFDERFRSWGCEDEAFLAACVHYAGRPLRVEGPAFHLWHPPASTPIERQSDPLYLANYELHMRYQRAVGVKNGEMDELVLKRETEES